MKKLLRNNYGVILIFGMALIIRLIYLLQIKSGPFFFSPMIDEFWNVQWAQEIMSGPFWGTEIYFRGPLYPYFLAALFKLTGSDYFWTRLIQMLFSSGSVALTYLIGRELFSPRIALLASIFSAVYGTMIFYDAMFLIPVLFVFLNLLGLYILIKNRDNPRKKPFLLAGLVFGLSAIARPNILLVVPFLAVWLFFLFRKKIETRAIVILMLLFLVGVGAMVLPVTVRNYLVTDDVVLISSQGGINLYLGNNTTADGLTMRLPEIVLDSRISWDEFNPTVTAHAEKEVGHRLKPSEVSSFWSNKAKQFIFEHPGQFLGLTYKKLVYFLSGFENSDQHDIYDFRRYSSLLSVLIFDKGLKFPYGLFAPLALLGIALTFKRRRELAPLLIFLIAYLPTIILFLVTARHRLTMIPILLLFAAAAIFGLWQLWREGKRTRILVPLAALALMLVVFNTNFFDLGFRNVAQTHHNLAINLSRQGNYSDAIEEYKLAITETPGVPTLYFGLGTAYFKLGQYAPALEQLRHAIALDPEYSDALMNLAHTYLALDDYERAARTFRQVTILEPDRPEAFVNLGDAYMVQDDLNEAVQAYLQALDLRPEDAVLHAKLGVMYGRAGDTATAYGFFRNFVAIDSTYAAGYLNWGNIYLVNGDTAAAIEKYETVRKYDSLAVEPYYNLAVLYVRLGDRTKALENVETLLRINPNFEQARVLRQRLLGN